MVSKKKINLVSDLPSLIFHRSNPNHPDFEWVYSRDPVDADYYVIYGVIREFVFPSQIAPRIFVTTEPPEIFRYSKSILLRYNAVLGGDFEYLRDLPNLSVATGLLNWSAGLARQDGVMCETKTVETLGDFPLSQRSFGISIVTSTKRVTKVQKERLALIEYLSRKINNLHIFGRGFEEVGDKSQVLTKYTHHLALENHKNPSFWTEKVADAILCNTRTYYFGNESILQDFGSNAVLPLPFGSFDDVYRKIMVDLENTNLDHVVQELTRARKYLIETANIHSRIISRISRPFTHSAADYSLRMPNHPKQLSNMLRLKFFH
jgi:hypothetical protein